MTQQASAAMSSETGSAGNQLRLCRSPYLQQHAEDPVHWQPWGDAAFELARRQDRLVFLSIGYSTCHWCHVMHRESFQNPALARLLNDKFVSIKVDREERPDVDRVYMNFVLALGVGGGWPLSVWLTPDRRPVFGGTYFPPDSRYGRPGFGDVLNSLATTWRSKRQEVEQQGQEVVAALRRAAARSSASANSAPDAKRVSQLCLRQLSSRFDSAKGGFGQAPKFPQPSQLRFLLTLAASLPPDADDRRQALHMCSRTLHAMARGGIYDHVNGGFHRYSTDADWHVPHFEKMLYDQAQLLHVYALASRLCGDQELADVAHDTVRYVLAEMSHPCGAFYSAQDADSLPTKEAAAKTEGAFCVWSWQQLQAALGDSVVEGSDTVTHFKLITTVFSCREAGNVDPRQDPHGELTGQNVLIRRREWPALANELGLSEQQLRAGAAEGLRLLAPARAARPPPHLDDKVLTSWNSMMLAALATAGRLLGRSDYVQRAAQCAAFIRDNLWHESSGQLHRVCYLDAGGQPSLGELPVAGYLDDHAQLVRGLLSLYSATLDESHLELARRVQSALDAAFWSDEASAYYDSRDSPELPLRPLDEQDGAEPSGNSVCADNAAALRCLLQADAPGRPPELLFASFADLLARAPLALPDMAAACLVASLPPESVVLATPEEAGEQAGVEQLLAAAWAAPYRPQRRLLAARHAAWSRDLLVASRQPPQSAEAFVCKDFACQLPASDPDHLLRLLQH